MTNATRHSAREYPLGTLGLALMLIVARLVDAETSHGTGVSVQLRHTAARAGLIGVSLLGALIDGMAWTHRPRAATQLPHAG